MIITPVGVVHDTIELRKIIADNPDLPIAVMVGENAVSDEYNYTYCTDLRCYVGEVLDCTLPFGEGHLYEDRIEFQEDLENYLCDITVDDYGSNEFDQLVQARLAEYEPYWKKVIIVRVDN